MGKIIKEVSTPNAGKRRVVLRSNHYSRSLAHVLSLVNAAKADFIEIKDDDIEVVIYGGRYIKGTMGVEFNVQENDSRLENYKVAELHLTR